MGIKPTNYIYISRVHSSIKESVLLDPGLYIPPFLRPALRPSEREDDRKNLRLESTHGGVYADVGIVPGGKGRAKLWMKSMHGGVTAKIVRFFLLSWNEGADERINGSTHPQTQTSTSPRPPSTSPSNPRMATCASTSRERSMVPSSSPSRMAPSSSPTRSVGI